MTSLLASEREMNRTPISNNFTTTRVLVNSKSSVYSSKYFDWHARDVSVDLVDVFP